MIQVVILFSLFLSLMIRTLIKEFFTLIITTLIVFNFQFLISQLPFDVFHHFLGALFHEVLPKFTGSPLTIYVSIIVTIRFICLYPKVSSKKMSINCPKFIKSKQGYHCLLKVYHLVLVC